MDELAGALILVKDKTMNKNYDEFEALKGKVITHIYSPSDASIIYIKTQDACYKMFHAQDCRESVYLEDVAGDWQDIIDHEILLAETVTNAYTANDSHVTWTFYKLSTIKGSITLRWFGTSNGYYSEEVEFTEISPVTYDAETCGYFAAEYYRLTPEDLEDLVRKYGLSSTSEAFIKTWASLDGETYLIPGNMLTAIHNDSLWVEIMTACG